MDHRHNYTSVTVLDTEQLKMEMRNLKCFTTMKIFLNKLTIVVHGGSHL